MARHVLTEDELARGRKIGASLGGKAVAARTPPDRCPRCDEPMTGRSWHSYLGHLGLHGLTCPGEQRLGADNWFAGDVEAAQRRLRRNGLARQDPFPGNGAWPEYRPITEG